MHRQICHVSFKNHRELIHWSKMVTIQLPTAKFYIHKRFITKCNLSKVQFSDLFWDFFLFHWMRRHGWLSDVTIPLHYWKAPGGDRVAEFLTNGAHTFPWLKFWDWGIARMMKKNDQKVSSSKPQSLTFRGYISGFCRRHLLSIKWNILVSPARKGKKYFVPN